MQITALTHFAHGGSHISAGCSIDLPDSEARELIVMGRAVACYHHDIIDLVEPSVGDAYEAPKKRSKR